MPHESPKGEKAWRLIVKQNGAEASAAILRVDGDTGALTGTWQDGRFVLSHFDGSRPGLMEITARADGTLELQQRGSNRDGTLIAYRPEGAKAGAARAVRLHCSHDAARRERTIHVQRAGRGRKILSSEWIRSSGQGAAGDRNWHVVPELPRRGALSCSDAKYRDRGLEIVALSTSKSLSSRTAWIASARS